jgi:S-adenosylmethionine:tRNA ribosyltransferase-isomerase
VTTAGSILPEPAEATAPPEARGLARDAVRLMVASPDRLVHARFRELPERLVPGDLLVVNTSRTLPAALPARSAEGEPFTLNLSTPVPRELRGRWVVELRSEGGAGRAGEAGEELSLPAEGRARLVERFMGGRLWISELALPEPLLEYLERHGRPIRYRHVDQAWPLELYQTVYATEPGSAEMPSAGRPFTPGLIAALVERGIDVARLVLHTGVSSLERGEAPYPERYRVPASTAERINLARRLGGRVIAVGTTVVRALESAAGEGRVRPAAGWTDLVIEPGRTVHAVDGLLTGFHDSDSSHLSMLEAIAGRELIERTYREASAAGYLRHEFGDLLLIEP